MFARRLVCVECIGVLGRARPGGLGRLELVRRDLPGDLFDPRRLLRELGVELRAAGVQSSRAGPGLAFGRGHGEGLDAQRLRLRRRLVDSRLRDGRLAGRLDGS